MRALFDFDSVVTELGGEREVGRLTGNLSSAVYNWRNKRRLFPAKHYFRLKEALAEKGFYPALSLFDFTDALKAARAAQLRESA